MTAKQGKRSAPLPAPTPRTLMAALQSRYSTRFHMFLIVAASVSIALLVTRFLLLLGVHEMWLRYLVALALAYLTFFFGVYCWLLLSPYGKYMRRHDWSPDGLDLMPNPGGGPAPTGSLPIPMDTAHAAGGEFGGGGASGNWDVVDRGVSVDLPDSLPGDLPGGDIVDGVGGVGGDEGGCLLVIAGILLVVLLSALFGASLYVIYQAPAILAEVIFEVMLGSPLARGARALDSANWPLTLLAKTWLPFAILSAAAMAFAVFVQSYFPHIDTAGGVLRLILKSF